MKLIIKNNQIMFIIYTYQDFCKALDLKKSDNPEERNDAKKALGVFRQKDSQLYDFYKTMYEGGDLSKVYASDSTATPVRPKKVRTVYDKEQYIREHPKIKVEDLRKKACESLLKFPYVLEIRRLSWITEEDFLASLSLLTLPDLITESGRLAQRETLRRNCVKQAVVDGRIDEMKLRHVILNLCKNNWDRIQNKPNYSFDSVKWFVMEVATAEELAYADINRSKVFDLIFDKRIKNISDEEIRDKELKKDIRKLAIKTGLNILYKRKNDNYQLPSDCNKEELKVAINKLSDDVLLSIYDGNKVDADKLYELCIRILTNKDDIKTNEIDMNAQGRKQIQKYIASLEEIKNNLESMRDDEEEKYDNMPEGLQESERGDAMQEAIDALEEAADGLEAVIDSLQGIV